MRTRRTPKPCWRRPSGCSRRRHGRSPTCGRVCCARRGRRRSSRAPSQRMTELGFLDDEAFARNWVESRDRGRPRGERALKIELRRKGVGQDVVEATLEDRRDTASAAFGDDPDAAVSPDEVAAERLIARRADPWNAWPTIALGASGRTRCWRAMGSIPRSRRVSQGARVAPRPASRKTSSGHASGAQIPGLWPRPGPHGAVQGPKSRHAVSRWLAGGSSIVGSPIHALDAYRPEQAGGPRHSPPSHASADHD